MASVVRDSGGRKRILFVAHDGTRKALRLGKVGVKQAEAFRVKLEALIGSRFTGTTVDDEVSRWLADLPDAMYEKLVSVGLTKPRAAAAGETAVGMTLGQFLADYTESRVDVKKGTQLVYGRTRKHLLEHFGADKPLAEISEGDADDWRLYLVGYGLAENTVRRTCGVARQFFRAAVRRRLIPSNPFSEVKVSVRGNPARAFFVSRADSEKILAACPNVEWKLIFALPRFGGLRSPSESLLLRWADINWEQGKMLVRSPKTEHHAGGESRFVPIFPELRLLLLEAFEQAEPGAEFVIARHRKGGLNLRTHLQRLMAKAGVKPWPKLFQNLRSTRQTELAESWPEHVVCAWLGNSRIVAREHYLQVTDEHFRQAAEVNSAAQNAAQQPSATPCNAMQSTPEHPDENAVFHGVAADCKSLQDKGMGGAGLEPATSCV
jgi:integrase